jgi:DNA-binding NarL/FixJ family response regulator
MSVVRVFVVEESPGLSDRLLERLSVIPELTVVGVARNLMDAVQQITTRSPDVVITDPELAEGSGLALLHMLHQRRAVKGNGPRVLLWTGDRDPRRWAIAQGLGVEARFDKAREVDLLVERCRGAAAENG